MGKCRDCRTWRKGHHIVGIICGCVILLLFTCAAGFIFTKDKAQSAAHADERIKNEGWTSISTNPLQEDSDPELNRAVEKYYDKMAENSGFAETYNNIMV